MENLNIEFHDATAFLKQVFNITKIYCFYVNYYEIRELTNIQRKNKFNK